MTDFALQRLNMVESQVRPSDVTDRRILRAMAEIRREDFVPPSLKPLAYMDEDVRLNGGRGPARALMAPRTLARLIQLAGVEPGTTVLEVGAATGYASAVLARLAGQVVALESDPGLAESARSALIASDVANVKVVTGPLEAGVPNSAPFAGILVSGSVSRVPDALLDQLQDGGRLVAILDAGGVERATVWHRTGMHFDARSVFDAHAAPLPGFGIAPSFAL